MPCTHAVYHCPQGVPRFATPEERAEVRRCMSTAIAARRAQRFDRSPSPLKVPHHHSHLHPAAGSSSISAESSTSFRSWLDSSSGSSGEQSHGDDGSATVQGCSGGGVAAAAAAAQERAARQDTATSPHRPGGTSPLQVGRHHPQQALGSPGPRGGMPAAQHSPGTARRQGNCSERTPQKQGGSAGGSGAPAGRGSISPLSSSPLSKPDSPESAGSIRGGKSPGALVLTPGMLQSAAHENPIYSPDAGGAAATTPPFRHRARRSQGTEIERPEGSGRLAAADEGDGLLMDLLSPARYKSGQLIGALMQSSTAPTATAAARGSVSPSRFSKTAVAAVLAGSESAEGGRAAKQAVVPRAASAEQVAPRTPRRAQQGRSGWREPLLVAVGALIAAGAAAAASGVVGGRDRKGKRRSPAKPSWDSPYVITRG